MSARVANDRRIRAGVAVRFAAAQQILRLSSQVRGEQAILLDDERAFGTGEFEPTRVAGKDGGGRLQDAKRPVGKLQGGDESVFDFDFVQRCLAGGLYAHDIAKEPEEKINRVDRLINQRASTIECMRSSPAR